MANVEPDFWTRLDVRLAEHTREVTGQYQTPRSNKNLIAVIGISLGIMGLSWGVGTYIFTTDKEADAAHDAMVEKFTEKFHEVQLGLHDKADEDHDH